MEMDVAISWQLRSLGAIRGSLYAWLLQGVRGAYGKVAKGRLAPPPHATYSLQMS